MTADLLHLLDLPAEMPAAEKAAAVVRRSALRLGAGQRARDVATVVESRWFAGTAECVRLLAQLFRGAMRRGSAFGGPWPYLEAAGRVVAPGLPVVATAGEADGPDGAYRYRGGVVWREAVGEDRPFLGRELPATSDDRPFDLLWYGPAERYLVRDATLQVEDMFSRLELPATPRAVHRLLPRTLRVDLEVLADLALGSSGGPATIEVRRRADLVKGERWRDPAEVLAARPGIRKVTLQADRLVAETERDQELVFVATEEPDGWHLYAWEGSYPLRTLSLSEVDGVLRFGGTLRPDLDPLTPGLRERLAFDLRSDLVALGS